MLLHALKMRNQQDRPVGLELNHLSCALTIIKLHGIKNKGHPSGGIAKPKTALHLTEVHSHPFHVLMQGQNGLDPSQYSPSTSMQNFRLPELCFVDFYENFCLDGMVLGFDLSQVCRCHSCIDFE